MLQGREVTLPSYLSVAFAKGNKMSTGSLVPYALVSQWARRDLNPHAPYGTRDFKSRVSAIPPLAHLVDCSYTVYLVQPQLRSLSLNSFRCSLNHGSFRRCRNFRNRFRCSLNWSGLWWCLNWLCCNLFNQLE